MSAAIERMLVVVPARDEADSVGACVTSIREAARSLRAAHPRVAVRVVVVADACSDATAGIARTAGAEVVEIDARAVGAARQAGVDHGLDPRRAAATWIATTDGDSAVPRSWLLDHLAAAGAGAALVVGGVEPDPAHLTPPVLAAWHARHDGLPPAASVHGANLGVRADALVRAGGFAPLALHEDVDLVARLRADGARVDAVDRPRVRTSGRLRGRAEGGFASYLAALAARQAC